MQLECLPISRIPHTTKLFSDFVHDFSRVSQFYGVPSSTHPPLEGATAADNYPESRRERVADVLESQQRAFGASPKALESIDRFRRGAAVAVTGQQVGFLGGPLFSIFKALTAVRIATESVRSGVDCVPVFWLATEDHDFEEIKSAVVQDTDGFLHTVTLDAELMPGAPMSNARLGDAIVPTVEEISRLFGESEVTEFIRQSYVPGETVGTAFAKLFARIFAEFGVILLDASDPELHRLAAPIYKEAVIRAESLEEALVERGKALHAAGYHEQVKVTPSSTLLFGTKDGARMPIHRVNGSFTLGGEMLTREELLARVDSDPAEFSANVLLRPVVQDFLLPTIAYTGGPAEVAYFAQAAVVYEQLLGRVTPVVPRFSATLVDARAQRLLDKYELSLADVLHGPEYTLELIAERSLPSDLQESFDDAEKSIDGALAKIMKSIQTLDPTLLGAAERAGNKMRYQLKRLRARAANAEVRQNEIIARHAAHLSASLFPHKQMQERVIAGASFLARYGVTLLDALHAATERGCPEHQVICLQ